METLRTAHIRFKDRHAGVLLEFHGGATRFEYAEDCGETIACALPRSQRVHEAAGRPPFFQHLGPEGWLRARQARTAEIADQDDLGLLLRYGADCIGAVSVHDPDPTPLSAPEAPLDAMTLAAVEARRTISGVVPKLLVQRIGDRFVHAGPAAPAPYIAKFPTSDLPELALNEALSLELARVLLGAEAVAASALGSVEGIRPPALLVRRFDRTDEGAKLRLEDFAQVLSVPRGRDYAGKYDASYEDASVAIAKHSASVRIDLLRYFERVVASFLLGDCDCHLKNFSLLEAPEGLRLSPAYDIVNTYVFARQGYSTRFGLRIGGSYQMWDAISRETLTDFGHRIGVPRRAVDRSLRRMAQRGQAVLKRLRPRPEWSDEHWRARYWATVLDALTRLEG